MASEQPRSASTTPTTTEADAVRAGYPIDPGWRTLWSDLGVSWSDTLAVARLPGDLLARRSQTLSAREYFALFRALQTLTADPLLPIAIAERYAVEAFQPPVFAALCSAHFAQAAARVSTYKRLMGPMRLIVTTTPSSLALELRFIDGVEAPPSGLVACELAFLLRLARVGTRAPVQATRVTVKDAAASWAPGFQTFFGVPVTHAASHQLVVSRHDAERPFLTSNDALWAIFEPALRRRLTELDEKATTKDRVQAALVELIPAGRASLGDVAKKLAASTRTLQRRLADEQTSFQAVLDATRRDLALHYLRQTSFSTSEIAFLLGFSESSSFFRAFQQWTGQTPDGVRSAPRPS
jgi:AraC-like DNA-binding protein